MLLDAAPSTVPSFSPPPPPPTASRPRGRASSPAPTATSVAELRLGLAELAPELFGRALRLARCPAAAEDLVQDTVERAMRFETYYEPGTNLRAWVHQILFSVFITRCRRRRRERNALKVLHRDPNAWTLPDAPTAAAILSPGVARALAALPEAFRGAVVLVDLEELSYKDAARRLGVPVGTVMSRLHRARRLLAEALRGERDERGEDEEAKAA
jgi:RNA polymerase sigma-70 factor (ECF subfamily)